MQSSLPNKTKRNYARQTTSEKLDKIDAWLLKMVERYPSKGALSKGEIVDWHNDLSPFSLAAIDNAFDTHRRNAVFFPVAGQIIDLCLSYDPPLIPQTTCDAICKARHGKGYGETDVKWLLFLYEKKKESVGNRLLAESEIEDLYAALDKKRGKPPEWRA